MSFDFQKNRKIWLAGAVLLVLLVLAIVAFWPVQPAAVAVVDLQPEVDKVTAGQTFTQTVTVQSGQAANAVDVTVRYPIDMLQVVSTDTKGSRFDMVLFQPKVDAGHGNVRFVQATIVPFSGNGGKVGTITFKARKSGSVSEQIGAKVVANSSSGTDLAAKPAKKALWQVWLKK
jgi:hypothetical protein